MRRLVLAGLLLLLLVLQGVPTAQAPVPGRSILQADAVVRLIADLESALASGRQEELSALLAPELPAADAARLRSLVARVPSPMVAIRERARRPIEQGFEVLTEVLVSDQRRGQLATWQLGVRPRAGAVDRFELSRFVELGTIGNLLRLELDATRQFAVHDLTLTAPDFTIRMKSGVAFVAESDTGVTAVALRGQGIVQFSPPSEAEQGQLRQFGGRTSLGADTDSVFVRLNPGEFAERFPKGSLQPTEVRPPDLARARDLFADQVPRTYNLDLRDLSRERWSLEPPYGSLVVEFRSRRHGWLTYARSPSDPEDISLFDRIGRRNVSVYASAERQGQRGPLSSEAEQTPYLIEHHALDLRLEPQRSWVAGRVAMRIRARQPLTSMTLKLADAFSVLAVRSPEFGYLLSLRVVGQNSIIVSLPETLAAGRVISIAVEYNGRLPPQGLNREAMVVTPQLAQDPLPPADILLVPEPRFMYSNSVYWYPQSPGGEYATATMRLTVPSEYQLVGSGTFVGAALTGVPTTPGRGEVRYERTVEYRADRPVRYLACVISRFVPVGRLRAVVPALARPGPVGTPDSNAEKTDGPPGVNVEVVATPRQTARSRALPARVAEILQFYAKTIGEAPYPDFTLATLDDNLPGGHSPAFFAVLHQPLPTTPVSWRNDPVAFESYPHFFLAHEVAHQWWGQAVGWKTYHEQWISEGLAHYFAWLYAESDRGQGTARSLMLQMRESALEFADQGPIWLGYRLGHLQDNPRAFRGVVYNKSAVVLQMLRRMMGDEAFFAGLRRFYASSRFRKVGTDDFRAALQPGTTVNVARFLGQWIVGSTLPRVRVSARVEGTGGVVRVEQLGPVFDFPYDVTALYADGRSEVVTLRISEAVSEHRLTLTGPVRRIETRDALFLGRIE